MQVLLGPALTYRRLAAPQEASATTANSLFTPGVSSARGSSGVTTQERPALAPGGQVQIRRSLNGRWTLAAGLGYRQYATALAIKRYQAPSPTSFINDSATTHRRDTYHYLTVPVQLNYGLGAPAGRWRTALQAGAELGVYVGGTTSEGVACACNTRTWHPTGSPYRILSLGLSLGLDVRYRPGPAGGPWELLAQPTATYGLTSLTRAGSGFNARYPLGAGLLLGLSRDLR